MADKEKQDTVKESSLDVSEKNQREYDKLYAVDNSKRSVLLSRLMSDGGYKMDFGPEVSLVSLVPAEEQVQTEKANAVGVKSHEDYSSLALSNYESIQQGHDMSQEREQQRGISV